MKKIAVSLAFSASLLLADFLGSSVSSITSGFNTNSLTSAAGNLQSTSLDSIFSSSNFSSFWQGNNGWSSNYSTLCYQASAPQTSSYGDICSAFSNINIDPCSLLPSSFGNFQKRSSSDRDKLSAPLRDWCKKINGTATTDTLNVANTKQGLSGKSRAEVASANFGSTIEKEKRSRIESTMKELDTPSKSQNSYAKKNQALVAAQQGHVVSAELDRLSQNTKETTADKLNALEVQPVFNNIEEYKNDLNAAASSEYKAQFDMFNVFQHTETANATFFSMNSQKKTLSDKKAFIDSYVDDTTKGIRKNYHDWAEQKAKDEILYFLPERVKTFYTSFNKKILLEGHANYKGIEDKNENAKLSIINYEIVKQELMEKEIMLKWRILADERADRLKTILYKNMYASELFDAAVARAEVEALVGK